MGWSLDRRAPKEAETLDEFLLAVGKAVYLATAFQMKCRYVLRLAKLAHHYKKTGDASATMALAQAMRDPMLGRTHQGDSRRILITAA